MKDAMAALDDEIAQLSKMPEGSSGWYMRQAKSFGLSLLRSSMQKGIVEPVAFDLRRQRLRIALMGDVTP